MRRGSKRCVASTSASARFVCLCRPTSSTVTLGRPTTITILRSLPAPRASPPSTPLSLRHSTLPVRPSNAVRRSPLSRLSWLRECARHAVIRVTTASRARIDTNPMPTTTSPAHGPTPTWVGSGCPTVITTTRWTSSSPATRTGTPLTRAA